jgi:signal transduction histidine kinase
MSDAELRSLRELHAVLLRVRPELDAAVEAVARDIPIFAQLLRSTDETTRQAQAEVSEKLARAALVDGEWEPYAAHLHQLGTMYAHMGVAFEDWTALLRPYREVIEAHVLHGSPDSARTVLAGMHLFLDKAMAALAHAYIGTKEQLVSKAEAQRDIYVQLFRKSPIGKLIYEWEDPPDVSTFRLLDANEQATALTEARVLTRLDLTFGEVGEPVTESELPHRLAAAMEQGEALRWTDQRKIDGVEHVFDCQCFPMGPRTVGVLFEDVTERRRTTEALARHARDLERSNRELDDFAYVASHDLKAPLRDIDSLSTWIAEDAMEALPEESRRHLSTIRERIARMERLLDDLLQYSRAGRVFQEPEPLDIPDLVANVRAVAALPTAFELVVTGEAPPIHAPRVPLELVLRNLVSNALKHHDRDAGRIEVALAPRAEHVEIAVTDDGPGIPPEFHERVFRMFQTLRPRDEVEGSGMGLAIVKKVVEAHGGTIAIESTVGEGTTVRFTWPRHWQRS